MAASSPDTPDRKCAEQTARLNSVLDMNRKVVQELKDAVENCVKVVGCPAEQAEKTQPN